MPALPPHLTSPIGKPPMRTRATVRQRTITTVAIAVRIAATPPKNKSEVNRQRKAAHPRQQKQATCAYCAGKDNGQRQATDQWHLTRSKGLRAMARGSTVRFNT
jgi:hypothetical protein